MPTSDTPTGNVRWKFRDGVFLYRALDEQIPNKLLSQDIVNLLIRRRGSDVEL